MGVYGWRGHPPRNGSRKKRLNGLAVDRWPPLSGANLIPLGKSHISPLTSPFAKLPHVSVTVFLGSSRSRYLWHPPFNSIIGFYSYKVWIWASSSSQILCRCPHNIFCSPERSILLYCEDLLAGSHSSRHLPPSSNKSPTQQPSRL